MKQLKEKHERGSLLRLPEKQRMKEEGRLTFRFYEKKNLGLVLYIRLGFLYIMLICKGFFS